jgi:hypothetical protein
MGGVLYCDELRATTLSALSATLGAVDISSAVIGSLIVGTSNLGIDSVTGSDSVGGSFPFTRTLNNMLAANRSLMQFKYTGHFSAPGSGGNAEFRVTNNTTGVVVYTKAYPVSAGGSVDVDELVFFFGLNAAGNNTYTCQYITNGVVPQGGVGGPQGTLTSLWWKR